MLAPAARKLLVGDYGRATTRGASDHFVRDPHRAIDAGEVDYLGSYYAAGRSSEVCEL